MTADVLALVGRSALVASIAAVLVIALRRPLRRVFGCGVAYGAWLVVPMCALAILVPVPASHVPVLGVTTFAASVTNAIPAAPPSSTRTWHDVALIAWLGGAFTMVVWQVRLQRAFVRSLGVLRFREGVAFADTAAVGPALVGWWRPVVVVPADFEARYAPLERELIVAHERAHARGGDPLVNVLCVALRCVWWFDPVVHIAARLVRADQELVRDADVVRAFPRSRQAYASTLLKAQLPPFGSAIACHWRSGHPLKERMMNLARIPSAAARTTGSLLLGTALLAAAYTAWAEQVPAPPNAAASAARWADARPTVVAVVPGPKAGQFLVRMKIMDSAGSIVLSEPRLLITAGMPASIETGSDADKVRFVVTVDAAGRQARYTTEVLRDGRVTSSQAGTLDVDRTAAPEVEARPTPTGEARLYGGSETGQYLFGLTFHASDAHDLSCAGDVFAARGMSELAAAMRAPADGKPREAVVSSIMPTVTQRTDQLVDSLAKCRVAGDSKVTWTLGRAAT